MALSLSLSKFTVKAMSHNVLNDPLDMHLGQGALSVNKVSLKPDSCFLASYSGPYTNTIPGRFLDIIDQDPSVFKSNYLHVDILQFFYII